tara:strand:+ start:480 stop:1139 length:660 start_codon:yes stop_codon:yes gene_type:complete
MKKIYFLLLIFFVLINFKTYEYQSINFQEKNRIETTYLLKAINFFKRYFETKRLIKKNFLNNSELSNLKKIESIFIWTKKNIELNYQNVVDDHHLNIIKRGKGTHDQRALVFAMLLNFLNIDSFYKCSKENFSCLTFVKLNNKWLFYDINQWKLNDLNKYKNKNFLYEYDKIDPEFKLNNSYAEIFQSLNKDIDWELYNNTSYIQTPIRRLVYFINEKR